MNDKTTLPPAARTDDKDWTWVLKRRCPECGADVSTLTTTEVAELNQLCAENWFEILQTHSEISTRPETSIWSPLEYGCHVRDVFRLFTTRLGRMLAEDNPEFEN